MSKTLTAERARELFSYEPETGVLRNRTNRGPMARAGVEAGYFNPSTGYRHIKLDGRYYQSHRIAFLLMRGRWPRDEVDHINGRREDNYWTNLREVSHQENQRNAKRRCDNTSGFTGVHWDKHTSKWIAQIYLNGRRKYLGCFDVLSDAVAVRKAAERQYGFHENHGKAAA